MDRMVHIHTMMLKYFPATWVKIFFSQHFGAEGKANTNDTFIIDEKIVNIDNILDKFFRHFYAV